MATSGSYNYNFTGADIIREALELLGIVAAGNAITGDDQSACLRTLNGLLKTITSHGIGLWKRRESFLYPSLNGYEFLLGPSGDNATHAGYKTELAVAASSGASSITVDSDDDITNGDYIGIELEDGTLHWTTVNGVPSSNVVALTLALTDSAAVDNHVYNYTTKMQRPLEIMNVRRVAPDGTESEVTLISQQEYKLLANKTQTGSISQAFYDPQLTNGVLSVWPALGDVQEYLRFTSRIQFEDLDSAGNDLDCPQEWFLPIAYRLARLVAPKFGKKVDMEFIALADSLWFEAFGFDRETTSIFFGVRDGY